MHERSDIELLEALKDSQEAAFNEIYHRYWYQLLVAVMKAVRSESDAEDIVQELFESLWKRRHELQIESTLPAYLFSSARYMGIRYITRHLTRSNYLKRLADHFDGTELPSIEAGLYVQELEQKINAAVADMPEKMREVFQLSRKHHLSHREIAQRLQISEETVKKQVYYALKLIRSRIGDIPVGILFYLTSLFLK
jgi:RNA polymerase sigma-70 factor (family 1)